MLFGIVSGNSNDRAFDVLAELKTSSVVLLAEEKAEIRQSVLDLIIPHETALVQLGYDNPKRIIA